MLTEQNIVQRCLSALSVAVLIMVTGGCGFALRGDANIPAAYQPIYVGGQQNSQALAQALRRQLEIGKVAIATKKRDAKLIVEVELLSSEKRSIALDREARDAEYALFERSQLSLYSPDGTLLRGPQRLEQRRLVVNDTDNPVGEETESNIVRDEMRSQLSVQAARQVEYWARQLDTTGN